MNTKIYYEGRPIAEVEPGYRATLPVKDKKMNSVIIVEVPYEPTYYGEVTIT